MQKFLINGPSSIVHEDGCFSLLVNDDSFEVNDDTFTDISSVKKKDNGNVKVSMMLSIFTHFVLGDKCHLMNGSKWNFARGDL